MWKRIPYVLLLVALWTVLKAMGISTSLYSAGGGVLLVLGMVALAVEFFRSGDIGLSTFAIDQAFSVAQLIVCTVVLTVLYTSPTGRITVPDQIIYFVVLLDAWFSPFNAFRTALRNLAVGPPS